MSPLSPNRVVVSREGTEQAPPALDDGEFLYHYTSFSNFLEIARNRVLRASAIQYLNDAGELVHAFDLAKEIAIEHLKKQGKYCGPWIVGGLAVISGHWARDQWIFQFSFSEAGDLLSQWRAYCPQGGVAFGIRRSRLEEIGKRSGFRLIQCVYDLDSKLNLLRPIVIPAVEALADLEAQLQRGTPNCIAPSTSSGPWSEQVVRLPPRLKHPSFEEEREWRLVSDRPFDLETRVGFHATSTALVPHLEIPLCEEGSALPIERVVVSPHPNAYLFMHSVKGVLAQYGGVEFSVMPSLAPYRPI